MERAATLNGYEISLENHLVNQKATDAAIAVYNFICDMRGQYILSGQQEFPGPKSPEFDVISQMSGAQPALRGFDFINNDFEGATRRALSWWNAGGLVSICWHLGTPPDGVGYESSKGWYDLGAALVTGSPEHQVLMNTLDLAVPYLQRLQDAGVPVLWRPLHEFDGGWFWWGKSGPEAFVELWRLMYNYYTYEKGLNNLIWVLGFTSEVPTAWYPGDAYCDIVGADIYAETNDAQSVLYDACYRLVGDTKPIVLHENGIIPDPAKLQHGGVQWSWFLTWHNVNFRSNSEEYLREVYTHDYVLTREQITKLVKQIAAIDA